MMNRARTAVLLVIALSASALAQDAHARAEKLRAIYQRKYSSKMVPMLTEVLRFSTVEGNTSARDQQQAWIAAVAPQLGLTVRNAGLVTEVELPGPEGAPVLGLVVHGDVQPVNEGEWTFPPFSGVEKNGVVYGRGAADDKGPLVQAMLAMASLKDSGIARTHTIRLLVGSDEESTNLDITSYLKDHKAPELSLVLDSGFPVVVGEKAWTAFTITSTEPYSTQESGRDIFKIARLDAGLAASIVPSQAEADLQWVGDESRLEDAMHRIQNYTVPKGYRLECKRNGKGVKVVAFGHSAHAGVNLEGGRNALVLLAHALDGHIAGPAADLLKFAGMAGSDIYGAGLALPGKDPLWGRYAVNVATIKPDKDDAHKLTLTINIRANPQMYGAKLRTHLEKQLSAFNKQHNEHFEGGGFYDDAPLAFDPNSKLVKRLMTDYSRATGENPPPAISGGGTYAKRLPNAIAFGMWFPGKPYPGHDVDEQITVKDLHRGVNVLLEALADVACSAPINYPFTP
jgi:succinyl-diaminopimelate desuccinylase